MRLDLTRIDSRINKLQELKQIAADEELTRLFVEFLTRDGAEAPSASAPVADDVAGAVQGILDDSAEPRADTGFGVLTRRRA